MYCTYRCFLHISTEIVVVSPLGAALEAPRWGHDRGGKLPLPSPFRTAKATQQRSTCDIFADLKLHFVIYLRNFLPDHQHQRPLN